MPDALTKLQDNLSAELAWRKKEIVALRGSVSRASPNRGYYSRAGLVILCAHWEGFLRSAAQHYVDFVFSQRLHVRHLSPNFVSICFYQDAKTAAAASFPGAEQHGIKLARRLLNGIDVVARRPGWKVTTGGNPSSTATSEILSSLGLNQKLGLDEAAWSTAKTFIDEQILKDRHQIAHGEGLPIDPDELKSRAERIIAMCEALTRLILDAAASGAYATTLPGEPAASNDDADEGDDGQEAGE